MRPRAVRLHGNESRSRAGRSLLSFAVRGERGGAHTAVYTVIVDAAEPARHAYANALAVGIGAFGVAKRRILEASLRGISRSSRQAKIDAAYAAGRRDIAAGWRPYTYTPSAE